MKPLLMSVVFALCMPWMYSDTIYVPGDYPAIQDALNAALDGDTILVAPGTYVENILFSKRVELKSEAGPMNTLIDANHGKNGVKFTSGASGGGAVLDGFTITNCSSGSSAGGSAVYCGNVAPVIRNNIIRDNHFTNFFDSGGGISAQYSSPEIYNNIIRDNSVPCWGGGIYLMDGHAKIWNNLFIGNDAANGGGIALDYYADCMVVNNLFLGNNAENGGGLVVVSDAKATIANSIFWNNTASEGRAIYLQGMFGPVVVTISCSNVEGGSSSVKKYGYATLNWGAGMIDADPLFVDWINEDFHLTYPSPCRDTGDSSMILGSDDFEGDPRMAYSAVDMGPDEFFRHLYFTGNPAPNGSIALKFIDTPNTAPVMLWLGSGLLDPPLYLNKYGYWHLNFPILMELAFGSIPGPEGVLPVPFSIPASVPTPLDLPMQSLIGSKLTNPCVVRIE